MSETRSADLLEVDIQPLMKRRIDEETCRKFGYGLGEFKGKTVQVAPYHDANGRVVAQKVRFKDKSFMVVGKLPKTFFGQHLWRNKGGKRLVITEGEIDAMSVYQTLASGKSAWPVVSIPSGSQNAANCVRDNIEFVESFEEVVICFDMDEPGRKAAVDVAKLLTPGKAKIASLPLKDANEMLQAGQEGDLYRAIWDAQTWRPDGIINASQLLDLVLKKVDMGLLYPWQTLNRITYGQHDSQIITWTAGSGIGKSAFVREVAYHAGTVSNQKIGYIGLEEGLQRTAKGFIGLHLNRPIHLPGVEVPREELIAAHEAVYGSGRFELYDHFGSIDEDNLFSRMNYLAHMGCKVLVLDHITIVMSGLEIDDERRALDQAMTRLRSFTERTGVILHVVSHLKRPEGKGHEEGAKPSLAQLRGSHGIVQLSDVVIGVQRNSSSPDPKERNRSTLWVLKNRLAGETGVGTVVRYSKDTGRLTELDWTIDDEGDVLVDEPDLPREGQDTGAEAPDDF